MLPRSTVRPTWALLAMLPALFLLGAPASAFWPDTPAGKLAVLLELQTLNADLLSHDSATLTLDRWCAGHRLADKAIIAADRVRGQEKEAPAEVRAQLNLAGGEPIAYRRVRLRCGERVLSEADNWYVPARLTADMNQLLATSDVPFGRVVQPLHFQRHTLSARLLWSPLPDQWDTGGVPLPKGNPRAMLSIPDKVIEHRALLTRADGTPFSYVVETYTGAVLDFQPPPLR